MLTDLDELSRVRAHLRDGLPGLGHLSLQLQSAGKMHAQLALDCDASQLRPGGTLSGPTMMTLADAAMYAAILATVGDELLAVTTDFNMHFLRRPAPGLLTARAEIIKLGQRLIVLTVDLRCDGQAVAHATGSYARPPAPGA